jgi:phosphorylcholine metabolism protein LicD
MRSIATSVALASIMAISTINGAFLGKNQFGINRFSVNLDLPEEERFVETSLFYKEHVVTVLKQYMDLVPESVLYILESFGA